MSGERPMDTGSRAPPATRGRPDSEEVDSHPRLYVYSLHRRAARVSSPNFRSPKHAFKLFLYLGTSNVLKQSSAASRSPGITPSPRLRAALSTRAGARPRTARTSAPLP